jgi:hypothetical protein
MQTSDLSNNTIYSLPQSRDTIPLKALADHSLGLVHPLIPTYTNFSHENIPLIMLVIYCTLYFCGQRRILIY